MSPAAWGRVGVAVLLATGCIIPDREIQFEGGPDNEGAVRILERPPLTDDMVAVCNAEPLKDADLSFCPPVRATLPSGLVRPAGGGSFCVCPGSAGRDNRALPNFNIYAEDPDFDGEDPEDTLYGVLLLDPTPDAVHSDTVAYSNYWTPCAAGTPVSSEDSREVAGGFDRTVTSEVRGRTQQWRFRVGDGSGRVDLCNDNASSSTGKLTPGLHNLQFMVTDRPFFLPPVLDEQGNQIIDNGRPQFYPLQCGVPDLAAGATYAVTNFVFECIDAVERPDACDCGEAEG